MPKTLFDIRRANLKELIDARSEGNRSAFGRMIGKNINLINLALTTNVDKRRNVGEKLARAIESACDLPMFWLDEDRSVTKHIVVTGLQRVEDDERTPADIFPERFVVGYTWLKSFSQSENPQQIGIYHQRDSTMHESLAQGEVGLIDTSVNKIKQGGLYLLGMGDECAVRRISVQVDGSIVITADDKHHPPSTLTAKQANKVVIKGKLIGKLAVSRL